MKKIIFALVVIALAFVWAACAGAAKELGQQRNARS